ncbi:MarR family winged helix-turn-helix transcriptional regulator [Leucobacter luti]|uniref:MarR family winged helix-turn-helix transcriptional regulator n=1 Tax=Leucobacter luti TaxID=340320 RepID=UPI0018E588CA|nr:MarR family transcriptional regulator [Leucobacter luti]
MQSNEVTERAALTAEVIELQSALETTAFPALVKPLLTINLTIQQLKILAIIVTSDDGSTGHELARSLDVSMATISGILDRLEAQQLITRNPDPRDLRVRRIWVTEAGRRSVQKLISAMPLFHGHPVARLATDDLRALTQGLRALLRVMTEPPGAEPSGAEPGGAEPGGAEPSGTEHASAAGSGHTAGAAGPTNSGPGDAPACAPGPSPRA